MSPTAVPNRLTLAVSLALFGLTAHADDTALPVVNVTAEHRSEDLQKPRWRFPRSMKKPSKTSR